MKYQSIMLGAVGAFACIVAAAAETYKRFDCGTNSNAATGDFMRTVRSLGSDSPSGSAGARQRAAALAARSQETLTIPTYFHVVTSAATKGKITTEMAQAQMAELNSAYAPHKIQFKLVKTSWTVNDAWAVGEPGDDEEMKRSLREGSYSALNIYFQTDLAGNILGRCTLPSAIGTTGPVEETPAFIMDGCNVQANTMPGGTIVGYNLGKTVIHETGHWMGLLHTFEGYSCKGSGDFVSDTPAQSTSTDGCPVKPAKDSCPGEPGVDNIRNYMDYSTG